jgi:5-methylcytosine-specific restriction endonuclease McrA
MWNPDRTDQRERFTKKYIDWRFAVIKRDKYTCQICGDKRSSGKKFCVDHIKPFSKYPELRYEISNGRVLCVDCHRKTETYCRKKLKAEKI